MKPNSYQAKCRAVVQRRGDPLAELPLDHFIALLTKAPMPEGGPLIEVEAPDYARQPVRWRSASGGAAIGSAIRNANRIVFAPSPHWPDATHVAITDQDGEVVGYGLLATAPGSTGHDEMTFEPTAIQLSYR